MDVIETIKGSTVQHGAHNDRIYLMHLNTEDIGDLIAALDSMAIAHGYGKVFAKIPAPKWDAFKTAGYVKEAIVPGLFNGVIDGFFIAKFFSPERQTAQEAKLAFASNHADPDGLPGNMRPDRSTGAGVAACTALDTAEMSRVYRQVFATYPFPIHDPTFLEQMMKKGVRYYCIRIEGAIAALSAAEVDSAHGNAEMTDIATLPPWRGRGLAGMLLDHMDKEMKNIGVKTAYTIARATSQGINAVFKNGGYVYAGLLKNNSQIGGQIQSMTVWYKPL